MFLLETSILVKKKIYLYQGSKSKKSLGRLLATNWRNIVVRCKFLLASLYNVNDAAQGLWYISQGREAVKLWNSGKSAKFTKGCIILWNSVEILSNTCLYNIFESYLSKFILKLRHWNVQTTSQNYRGKIMLWFYRLLFAKFAPKIPAKLANFSATY